MTFIYIVLMFNCIAIIALSMLSYMQYRRIVEHEYLLIDLKTELTKQRSIP